MLILSRWATIKTYRMGDSMLQHSELGHKNLYSSVALDKSEHCIPDVTVFQLQNLWLISLCLQRNKIWWHRMSWRRWKDYILGWSPTTCNEIFSSCGKKWSLRGNKVIKTLSEQISRMKLPWSLNQTYTCLNEMIEQKLLAITYPRQFQFPQ